jgi:hypothetical protein
MIDEIHGPSFEILKQSPVLGDNKFKLEIGQYHSSVAFFLRLKVL